ncbi:MAG: hypothetical protein WD423_10740 [Rhodothermales bacterium]
MDPQTDEEQFFAHYYSPDVRASLPFMQLEDETPVLQALKSAGFRDVEFVLLPADFAEPEEECRPYVVVAYHAL